MSATGLPMHMLPLFGLTSMPCVIPEVLGHHRALGANAHLWCITEEDWLYRRSNIARGIAIILQTAADAGLTETVTASAWGVGGLFGGEALSVSRFHRELTGDSRYLLSQHTLGPTAVAEGQPRIADTELPLIMEMQKLAAKAGATWWFYDEYKIQRPGVEPQADHVPPTHFLRLAEHAVGLGLNNHLCLTVTSPADIELAHSLCGSGLVKMLSTTQYYGAGSNTPDPETYRGATYDRLRQIASACGGDIRVMSWDQGFDFAPPYRHLVFNGVMTAQQHGIMDHGIWGGSRVNEQPFLEPYDEPAGKGAYYDVIAAAFGGTNPCPIPV